MKINLQDNSRSSAQHQRLMCNMALDMCRDYGIPDNMTVEILNSASSCVCLAEWAQAELGITMRHFHFSSQLGHRIAHGFNVLEDQHLISYMLRLDLTKNLMIERN